MVTGGDWLDNLVPGDDPGDDEPVASWSPVDLVPVVRGLVSGERARLEPAVGRVSGGGCLLYGGKVNSLFGESGCGKTWTALLVVAQLIADGRAAVYVDLEDDVDGVVGRLLDLGADPDDVTARFVYVSPERRLAGAGLDAMHEWLTTNPALVVIDSTGESIAMDGLRPNDDDHVAVWFRRLPAAIAKTGPAVLVLDHVPKADPESLWPSGSQRKRAAVSGAAYAQILVRPFSRDSAGTAKLVCAKDRHGTYRFRQKVAELHVEPRGQGRVDATFRTAQEPPGSDARPWRPTALMQRVSEALETGGTLSFRGVNLAVRGREEHVRAALEVLVDEGYVSTKTGPRNATLHSLERLYRQSQDPESDQYAPGDTRPSGTPLSDCLPSPHPMKGGGRQTLNTVHRLPETVGRQSGDSRPEAGPPADVISPPSACTVCGEPLNPVLAAAGESTHPACTGASS